MIEEHEIFVDKIRAALILSGAEEVVFSLEKSLPCWSFSLQISSERHKFKLALEAWSLTPLPYLKWISINNIWGYPHTSSDGQICVIERNSLDYEPSNIEGIINSLINDTKGRIGNNLSMSDSDRLNQFADELDAYAINLSIPKRQLNSDISTATEAYVAIITQNKKNDVVNVGLDTSKMSKGQVVKLPILSVSIHQLPPLKKKIDKDWWNSFIDNLEVEQKNAACNPNLQGLIIHINNRFKGTYFVIFWGRQKYRLKVRTIYLLTVGTRDYIMSRIGNSIKGQNIAIVGLGSVGSRIAEYLTLSGIDKMTLIDNDIMSSDNIGRHVLGMSDIGKFKVNALAALLNNRMPEINIKPISQSVENWIFKGFAKDFDCIVLATGDSPLEREVCRKAWREQWDCDLISVFVEPVGLGGHAILMKPDTNGCIDCLYKDNLFSGSLVAPNQIVSSEISGCGTFTAYSAMDATKTAMLAVELILDNRQARYLRWVGRCEQAKIKEIIPSETWNKLNKNELKTELISSEYSKPQGGCICCGC